MAVRAAAALILAIGVVGCRPRGTLPPETLAIADLRTVEGALRAYRAACGVYPPALESLGLPKDPSVPSPTCAHFGNLDGHLIALEAAGLSPPDDRPYALLYVPGGRDERGFQSYQLEARWLARDREVRPSFWTSEAGVWRVARGRPATQHDDPLR